MDKLKRFLEGAVVIPYNENVLKVINQACHNFYNGKNDDKFSIMENLAEYFLVGIENRAFLSALNAAVAEEGSLTTLPIGVVQRLAGYSCYCMVMEEADKRDSSILATIFMNFILLVKRRINRIPCGDLIQEMYRKHISYYLKVIDRLDDTGDLTLIQNIAESDDSLSYFKDLEDDDDMDVKLKKLAKSSAFYEYQKIFNNKDLQEISDPFVKVFIALCKFKNRMKYCYYDFPFYDATMNLLSEDESKTRKSIQKITESLKPYAAKYIKDLYSDSSLLLRLAKGETDTCLNNILAIQLNIKEFCVYLYYELLIDNILKQVYDGE